MHRARAVRTGTGVRVPGRQDRVCGTTLQSNRMVRQSTVDRHASHRTRVLSAAADLIAAEGLAGVQARPLAQAAGCSVGTFYNVFGNIDHVIFELNRQTLEVLRADVIKALEHSRAAGLRATLTALADTYLAFSVRETHAWRAVFDHRPAPDTAVPTSYRAVQNELFDLVADVIAPHLPADADGDVARQRARAVFAAVHGVVVLAHDELLGPFDADAVKRDLEFIMSSFADGVEVHGATAMPPA